MNHKLRTYFRVQPYDPAVLLDGLRTTTYWSDDADDTITVPGVAVCATLDALAYYIASTGAAWDHDWTVVELEGTPAGTVGGVEYVHPTRIVATSPARDSLSKMVADRA